MNAWEEREVSEVLASMAGVVDGDELVDELAHALQCATHALSASASAELVAAALFHDVGRAPALQAACPGLPHEEAGACWVGPRFGEKAAWLVAAHVPAKIYLVGADEEYFQGLSQASVASLVRQQALGADLELLAANPWWPDALQLRRWDDASKVPGAVTVGVDEIVAYLCSAFG